MTAFKCQEITGFDASPALVIPSAQWTGRVRGQIATIDLSETTVTDGDTVEVARIPKGARYVAGILAVSATLATSTLSIGTSDDAASLRADAVKTTLVPELFGVVSTDEDQNGIGEDLEGDATLGHESIILTAGTADFPTTGIVKVISLYMID